MTDNDIKTISEKIDSLHKKILKSKFAEKVTESEMVSLILAVQWLNRQKTEIDILIRKKETLRDEIAEQQAEIERLQKQLKEGIDLSDCAVKIFKADAIKEFAEKAKKKSQWYPYYMYGLIEAVPVGDIDNLVKEMVGDAE